MKRLNMEVFMNSLWYTTSIKWPMFCYVWRISYAFPLSIVVLVFLVYATCFNLLWMLSYVLKINIQCVAIIL